MNVNDVITLVNAGFSADEVKKLLQVTDPVPEAEPAPAPEPEPAKEPEKDPEPDKIAEYERQIEALRQSVEDLRSTFSAAAVRQDNIGAPNKETVADILTGIINPRTNKEV